jgi:hypothetical protein
MVAVAGTATLTLSAGPGSDESVEPSDPASLPFAHAIDHVPLS